MYFKFRQKETQSFMFPNKDTILHMHQYVLQHWHLLLPMCEKNRTGDRELGRFTRIKISNAQNQKQRQRERS